MIEPRSFLLPAIVIAGLLTGCLEPRTEWVKEGADADELRYARQTCERESSGYAFVDDDLRAGPSSRDRGPSSARSDVYRRCMEAQGWRRERSDRPSAHQPK